jgi:hypothetical protein
LIPISKQKRRNSTDVNHCIVRNNDFWDRKIRKKTLSFNTFAVALVVASRSGTDHTNFEDASTRTTITEFPALLRGNLPKKIKE